MRDAPARIEGEELAEGGELLARKIVERQFVVKHLGVFDNICRGNAGRSVPRLGQKVGYGLDLFRDALAAGRLHGHRVQRLRR